jgi:hypothetical protein
MGDGKTIAKLSYSKYTNFMDIDYGEDWKPGGLGGDVQFYWNDYLGSVPYQAEIDELFWYWVDAGPEGTLYRVFDDSGNFQGDLDDARGEWYSGFDPANPLTFGKYHYTERGPGVGSMWTQEIMATVERELIPDLGLTVNGTWRKYHHYNRTLDFWIDSDENIIFEQNKDIYIQGPPVPEDLTTVVGAGYPWPEDYGWDGYVGPDAANSPWYYRNGSYTGQGVTDFNTAYSTDYGISRPNPTRWDEYYGVDIILNKRFSNKWMFNFSFTLQGQKEHWGSDGVWDRSNEWANNGVSYSGGTFSTWMVKAAGLYQLPYGFNVSFFFNARQGFKTDETFQFRYYSSSANDPAYPRNSRDYTQTIYIQKDNAVVLPTFAKLDIRIEKMLNVADVGKIYLMADIFNVFNNSVVTGRNSKYWGRFYYYGEGYYRNRFVTEPRPYQVNDVLAPFIARFGVRFEF